MSRWASNVCSCKHGSRLKTLSHKKRELLAEQNESLKARFFCLLVLGIHFLQILFPFRKVSSFVIDCFFPIALENTVALYCFLQ